MLRHMIDVDTRFTLCYLNKYVAPAIKRRIAGTLRLRHGFGRVLPAITPPTPGGGTLAVFTSRFYFLWRLLLDFPRMLLIPLYFSYEVACIAALDGICESRRG